MRGKYWEMWHFEFTAKGIELKENYMPKKYAVMILLTAGFLTTFGACICFLKKYSLFRKLELCVVLINTVSCMAD
tara:strand:+ start:779 stop:1003 length:225 start_codon:yes stop_codon:yes gene_type:complete